MANISRRVCFQHLKQFRSKWYFAQHSRSLSVLANSSQVQTCTTCLFKNLVGQDSHKPVKNLHIRYYSSEENNKTETKPTLVQKFKQMYKSYWYVLLPVHVVTSTIWFGGFYYLAKSGVDIPALLDSLSVSEKITNPLRDSSMGYVAVAYALYKIATPARYTITLGGTTISINYLKKWGYIKPVPSKERLKEMYMERKENIIETMKETRDEIKAQSEKLKDKKDDIIQEVDKSLKQFKGKIHRTSGHVQDIKTKLEKKK